MDYQKLKDCYLQIQSELDGLSGPEYGLKIERLVQIAECMALLTGKPWIECQTWLCGNYNNEPWKG